MPSAADSATAPNAIPKAPPRRAPGRSSSGPRPSGAPITGSLARVPLRRRRRAFYADPGPRPLRLLRRGCGIRPALHLRARRLSTRPSKPASHKPASLPQNANAQQHTAAKADEPGRRAYSWASRRPRAGVRPRS